MRFERLGWSGICIEPLPEAFAQPCRNRIALCLNVAVSDFDGTGRFAEIDFHGNKMLSGLRADYDPRHVKRIEANATGGQIIEVPVRRLSSILAEDNIGRIDYLSIDT